MQSMRPLFQSKHELVYHALKEAILQGELRPGQRLILDTLATTLGVSVIPVREALRQLEADGLVETQAHVGATVTAIRAEHVGEIFALLEALEIASSRAACQSISEASLDALAQQIRAMDNMVGDLERWSEHNRRLHLFICDKAGMRLTGTMMATAFDHWDRLRRCYLQDVFGRRVEAAQEEHHRILAALQDRDPDAVERTIRAHNQAALAAYLRHIQLHHAGVQEMSS